MRVTAALAAAALGVAALVVIATRDEPSACPTLGRNIWAGGVRRGPDDALASRGATAVVVCAYDPDERRPRATATLATAMEPREGRPLEARPTGRRIADAITDMAPPSTQMRGGPVRVRPCVHTGPRYVVVFRYGSHSEAVDFDRSDCNAAFNGTWHSRWLDPGLPRLLAEAVA